MVSRKDQKIIAFGHQKEVGKSSAAKFLDTYIRTTCPKIKVKNAAFACKLKDVAFQMFSWAGLNRGIYYETHYEEKEIVLTRIGLSPRDIWIAVGNKMREINETVWLINAINCPQCDTIIISDLRFYNEAEYIRHHGGILVKIARPGMETVTDAAETSLLGYRNWDHVIINDGTLEDLNVDVMDIWESINA